MNPIFHQERLTIKTNQLSMGKSLFILRHQQGLNQFETAVALGVSKPTYIKWENNTSDIPHSKLFLIAKIYNISIEHLISMIISQPEDALTSGDQKKIKDELVAIQDGLKIIENLLDCSL